ncbi:MAG: glycosyltransferase family 2 protein [Hyphomonas sp.]|nr:glycosyltransferase family 2 protein [Hyphomonas sp.]
MISSRRVDVSILIVSFNTREMTLDAISSVVRETRDVAFEIIVVDNNSADGSADAIAAHPAAPKVIALSDNIGFGRANNLAAEYATGDYVLLLNPDTIVRDRAIDRLVGFARENKRALIWGGRTVFADGSLNPASCWQRITLFNLVARATGLAGLFPNSPIFNPEAYGGWARDTVREVDIVSGCFLLIPRSIWMALGGFDPQFFMYGEEADLCLRARRIGARPLLNPHATIVHFGGASEKTRAGKMVKLLAAKATLIERHWPRLAVPLGRFLLMMWPLSRWLACSTMALLQKTGERREAADAWRTVWKNREEWRTGYPKHLPEPGDRQFLPLALMTVARSAP